MVNWSFSLKLHNEDTVCLPLAHPKPSSGPMCLCIPGHKETMTGQSLSLGWVAGGERGTFSIVQSGVCLQLHEDAGPGLLRSFKGQCSQRGMRVHSTRG